MRLQCKSRFSENIFNNQVAPKGPLKKYSRKNPKNCGFIFSNNLVATILKNSRALTEKLLDFTDLENKCARS
jgi:hypothetical protein